MPERFECTITLAKKRYINTLPFLCMLTHVAFAVNYLRLLWVEDLSARAPWTLPD